MSASADQVFCTKMLFVVALFAWSTTCVATAGSTPTNLMLSMYEALDTTSNPVVTKVLLKSTNADMTARNQLDEERAPLPLDAVSKVFGLEHIIEESKSNDLLTMKNELAAHLAATEEHNIFENQGFLQWAEEYRGLSDKKRRTKALETMLAMLAKHYKGEMLHVLAAGKQIKEALPIVDVLEGALTRMWVEDGRSVTDVYILLKLHKVQNPFESPLFHFWTIFVINKLPSTTKRSPYTAMLTTLKKYYNVNNLARLLAARLRVQGNTDDTAGRLLDVLLKNWKADTKMNYLDKVYKLLELGTVQEKLAESVPFKKWASIFWLKLPVPRNEVLRFLAHRFDGEDLISVLVAGTTMKNKKTKKVAMKLLDSQLREWIHNPLIKAEELFERLKLDLTGSELAQSPLFQMWSDFYRSRDPISLLSYDKQYKEMLDFLALHCTNNKGLASVLVDGTRNFNRRAIAEKKLDILMKKWLMMDINADECFKLLELDTIQGRLVENPLYAKYKNFEKSKLQQEKMTALHLRPYTDDGRPSKKQKVSGPSFR